MTAKNRPEQTDSRTEILVYGLFCDFPNEKIVKLFYTRCYRQSDALLNGFFRVVS